MGCAPCGAENSATFSAGDISICISDVHESFDYFKFEYYPIVKLNGIYYSGKDDKVPYYRLYQSSGRLGYSGVTVDNGSLEWQSNISAVLKMPNSNVRFILAPADFTTGHEGSEADPYPIYTSEQWDLLATNVNGGTTYSGKYFKLMNSITVTTMVGNSDSHSFQGTFDGGGRTLTFNYNSNEDRCAPFRYINGATIKYLHVTGTITKTKGKYAAGIASNVKGNNNVISNCRSSIAIVSSVGGDISSGGFIGEIRGGGTTITNCLFDGKLQGTLNNCYYNDVAKASGLTVEGLSSYNISGSAGVVVSFNATTAVYDVSGITVPLDLGAIGCKKGIFARPDAQVSLNLDTDEGYTITSGFTASAGMLTGSGNPYFLTMASKNVTISADAYLTLHDDLSNSATVATKQGATTNVLLSGRTFYKDGSWNTLCLPFSLVSLDDTPLAGATLKELDAEQTVFNATTGTLTLRFRDATSIEAGKPYILKWDSGSDIVSPEFANVTLTTTEPTAVTSSDGQVKFEGQFSPFAIDDTNKDEILFLSEANKIGYSQDPRQLRNFRAHFCVQCGDDIPALARTVRIDFGNGEVTSVSEEIRVKSEESAVARGWYDLQGRRLNGKPMHPGVYINKGNKVVIK